MKKYYAVSVGELSAVARLCSLLLTVSVGITGCGDGQYADKAVDKSMPAVPTPKTPSGQSKKSGAIFDEASLHAALRSKNADYTGDAKSRFEGDKLVALDLSNTKVTDLSPLKGVVLQAIDVFGTGVSDLSPLAGSMLSHVSTRESKVADISVLKGMPVQLFDAAQTPLTDLSALKGAPLQSLNLLGTRVSDLSPITGAPLQIVWLNSTPVTDIGPLAQSPSLKSVTLTRSLVSDLSPLRFLRGLQRLQIEGTQVTDLTPLADLPLQRLIFSPGKITKGIDVIRKAPTLRHIDTHFTGGQGERLMSPAEFWQRYDKGEFKK